MTYKFSKRSGKYVWLSLSGLLPLVISFGWLAAIAPNAQQQTRQETQWRADVSAQKARADYLQENQIHTDYKSLIFSYLSTDQSDLQGQTYEWLNSPAGQAYSPGQTIRLLDQFHTCFAYLVAGQGLYFESDNPGLCATPNAEVEDRLKNANPL